MAVIQSLSHSDSLYVRQSVSDSASQPINQSINQSVS